MALIDDLISYWKLDESSGNAEDAFGTNDLSNENGGSNFVAGKINNCISLNKTLSQYLKISNASQTGLDFDSSDQFTISLWLKFTSFPAPSAFYFLVTKGNGTTGYLLNIGNSSGNINVELNLDSSFVSQTISVSTDVWYNLVITWKGSESLVSYFLNGSLVGTDTGPSSISSNSNDFSIGTYAPSPSNYFDGLIDEVGIWSRALSSGEVSELYNSGNGLQYPFVPPVVAPSVDTLEATDITTNSGTLNGEITDTGGENADERGFVWDSESKSAPGNVAPASSGYEDYFTDSGDFSEGVFDHGIESLDTGTIYYFRAYAHNSEGYTYGEELTIETLPAEIFRFENIPGVEYNPNDKQTIFAERLNEILDRLHDLDGLDPYEE